MFYIYKGIFLFKFYKIKLPKCLIIILKISEYILFISIPFIDIFYSSKCINSENNKKFYIIAYKYGFIQNI